MKRLGVRRVYAIIAIGLGLSLGLGCKSKPPAPASNNQAKPSGGKDETVEASPDGIVMPVEEAPGPEPEAGSLPFEFGPLVSAVLSVGQPVFFVRRGHWVESFGEQGAFWRYAYGEVVEVKGSQEVKVRADGADDAELVPTSLVIGLGHEAPLEAGQLVLTRSPGERPYMTRALVLEGGAGATKVRYLDLRIDDGSEALGLIERKNVRVIEPSEMSVGQRVYWAQGAVRLFGRVVAKDETRAMVQGFGGEIVVKALEELKPAEGVQRVKQGQRVQAPFINQYLAATVSEVEGELVTVRYAHSPAQVALRLWRGELMP